MFLQYNFFSQRMSALLNGTYGWKIKKVYNFLWKLSITVPYIQMGFNIEPYRKSLLSN